MSIPLAGQLLGVELLLRNDGRSVSHTSNTSNVSRALVMIAVAILDVNVGETDVLSPVRPLLDTARHLRQLVFQGTVLRDEQAEELPRNTDEVNVWDCRTALPSRELRAMVHQYSSFFRTMLGICNRNNDIFLKTF